jgi:L-amino acid N-acyltransferase YncA
VRLRLVEPGDAEAIRAIYNSEVASGSNTFDLVTRSLEEQRAWITRHRGAHPALVALDERPSDLLVGFAVISPFRDRAAYATTVEDSVYVHSARRGQGVGRRLLEELLVVAAAHGFHTVIARVSSENEASLRLHRSCGFETVGVEREVGRKHGRWLDVVELQRML